MKYYISDLHLQHANILKYDNRPFRDIDTHDETIVDIINKTVWVDDILYILWDISWKWNKSIETLANINCKSIYFTIWNHDFQKYRREYEKLWWINLGNMYIDKVAKVVLCHYPMDEWYHSNHKDDWRYIHIHWHSHWNSKHRRWRVDVGITFKDVWRPISLEEIQEIISYTDEWWVFHAKGFSWWKRFKSLFILWR